MRDGYGTTNLQDIANKAGVAVQTIYFVFGNKRSPLKELVDVTIAGDDEPVATMDRPWFHAAMAADHEGAEHGRGDGPRGGGALVVRHRSRYTVQRAAADALMAKPGAWAGVSAEFAADVLYTLLSPEVYLQFVEERGWRPEQWEEWVHGTLAAQLLQPE
ncbi:TetR family transcriptional regulator [Nonomuraea sp. 10N515B]|uniref:TetR family transcriptional regulator n=1 Tax=Nonomuraea sp. 10N515B TaxID=3457422 RepID=UPI003FCC49DE